MRSSRDFVKSLVTVEKVRYNAVLNSACLLLRQLRYQTLQFTTQDAIKTNSACSSVRKESMVMTNQVFEINILRVQQKPIQHSLPFTISPATAFTLTFVATPNTAPFQTSPITVFFAASGCVLSAAAIVVLVGGV